MLLLTFNLFIFSELGLALHVQGRYGQGRGNAAAGASTTNVAPERGLTSG